MEAKSHRRGTKFVVKSGQGFPHTHLSPALDIPNDAAVRLPSTPCGIPHAGLFAVPQSRRNDPCDIRGGILASSSQHGGLCRLCTFAASFSVCNSCCNEHGGNG